MGALSFTGGIDLYPRPNLNVGVPLELFGSQYPGGKILNSAAFSEPPAGQQGDFGRNVLRGFGATQFDFGLQRQFRIMEMVGLHFRGEFFNIINHPNFGSPDNDLTSPLFGHSTQTRSASAYGGAPVFGFRLAWRHSGTRAKPLS